MIFAEQLGAKIFYTTGAIFQAASLSFIPAVIGTALLVLGYMLGLKHFENIWVITVVSFGSILIIEPLFNLFFIGHTPSPAALVGFVLVIIAIGITLIFP